MPLQDRTGSRYEQLIAASLLSLGYRLNSNTGLNYLHPRRGGEVVVPYTYIQPDFVIRNDEDILAIIYVTHWSNTRNSAFKFWRTWEETAQQKVVLGNSFSSINCIFEALPENWQAQSYVTSDDIPEDPKSDEAIPLQFSGWYSGISWAIAEAFDVSIVFPVGYSALEAVSSFGEGDHAPATTQLLQRALNQPSKTYFQTQWQTLQDIRLRNIDIIPEIHPIQSRYRIGLLHVYLFYRMVSKLVRENTPALHVFISSLVAGIQSDLRLDNISRYEAFRNLTPALITTLFNILSQIYVRTGSSNARMFCTLEVFSDGNNSLHRIVFNDDLSYCLRDLNSHIHHPGFLDSIIQIFTQFDETYGIDEALDDFADLALVRSKETLVRSIFANVLSNEAQLNNLLQSHAKEMSPTRMAVSTHQQNWVFEMLCTWLDLLIWKIFKSDLNLSLKRQVIKYDLMLPIEIMQRLSVFYFRDGIFVNNGQSRIANAPYQKMNSVH